MLKKDLRSHYTLRRASISDIALLSSSLSIAKASLKLPIWSHQYYHLFLTISEQKEINTSFILSILQGKNKNIVVPKVVGKGILKHYLLTNSTILQKNRWNVPEPVKGCEVALSKIDIVFVPLIAFDLLGNRVGYGKGFYDRFLSECRADVKKIGLSLFEAEEAITDVSENDIPLDYCITPNNIYSF
ncbi:5-formyltetrahydrofolate cyclo-ligase [Pareuzebyella sediminis]|uniref:5-formyltetrahydrofolate cyclo-ligase n=1 Tax=Pareuzebyella sediminis TaxID=2607998 RepID=UPI0011EEA022|nr:5-formyltetrahydrofolate cyclo-ligase [Pareuzebyella sediminis]